MNTHPLAAGVGLSGPLGGAPWGGQKKSLLLWVCQARRCVTKRLPGILLPKMGVRPIGSMKLQRVKQAESYTHTERGPVGGAGSSLGRSLNVTFSWAKSPLSDLSYLTRCFCHLEWKESSGTSFHLFATGEKGIDVQEGTTGISYKCLLQMPNLYSNS